MKVKKPLSRKSEKIIVSILIGIGMLIGGQVEKRNAEIGKFIKDVLGVISVVAENPDNTNDSITINQDTIWNK